MYIPVGTLVPVGGADHSARSFCIDVYIINLEPKKRGGHRIERWYETGVSKV